MEVEQGAMKFVIVQHIADISWENNGCKKELNLVSWHDREPVNDMRTGFRQQDMERGPQ